MSSFKKNIFLSNKQDIKNKSMAIVTLEKKNQNIFGTIKTFNLDTKNNYILGIKLNEKIYKQNIILDDNKYNFLISNTNDLDCNIGCVLLSSENNSFTPIIWGSDSETNYKSQIINSLQSNFEKIKNNEILKKEDKNKNTFISNNGTQINTPNENKTSEYENKIDYTTHLNAHSIHASNLDLESNNTYNKTINIDKSEIAIASNYAALFDSSNEEVEKEINNHINKSEENNFYNMIAEQLDELFEKYPKEETLEKLIDNSKWIKIRNDDNKYYVVGVIYNNNDIKYVCYGVPGNYSKEPPIELIEYSQWLPTDIMNPYDNGYWVMYQDANTGENVIIN